MGRLLNLTSLLTLIVPVGSEAAAARRVGPFLMEQASALHSTSMVKRVGFTGRSFSLDANSFSRERIKGGYYVKKEGDTTSIIAASIPTEDVIVRAKVPYVPQFMTDVFGKTTRVTKDITFLRLLKDIQKNYPGYELVSLGTPINFDLAPTHLTRVEMHFKTEDQVQACLKAISVSDMLIRSRVQPAWEWNAPARSALSVLLHVSWYDTVYFMQFKDIFLGEMHCRYSAKFSFNPRDALMTHFRYNDSGDLEKVEPYNEAERHADSIKDKIEFLRVFRDKTTERT